MDKNSIDTERRAAIKKIGLLSLVTAAAIKLGLAIKMIPDNADEKGEPSTNDPNPEDNPPKEPPIEEKPEQPVELHPIIDEYVDLQGLEGYSAEIQQRVRSTVLEARKSLWSFEHDPQYGARLLENPYVVYALYVSLEFSALITEHVQYPQEVALREVSKSITPAMRHQYNAYLQGMYKQQWPDELGSLNSPMLDSLSFGHGDNEHTNAIDLFTPEGNPVYSVDRGIVVLAESGWNPDDILSTSSIRGGNTVIMYHNGAYFRYAHFDQVAVRPGMIIESGTQLGTVGHSGLNAAKPGHGEHVHFEHHTITSHGDCIPVDSTALRIFVEKIQGL